MEPFVVCDRMDDETRDFVPLEVRSEHNWMLEVLGASSFDRGEQDIGKLS